jgi:leader peptidase (prepilin peptidase)/N-methyltransferase
MNVVVVRVPRKKSVVKPASHCPVCKEKIRWYDNVPVLSYLWLRGSCRFCKTKIPFRYVAIELLTALLFLATLIRFGAGPLLLVHDWPFVAILVAITFIDLEHRIIPDVLSLGGLALGLATSWWVPELGLIGSVAGAALGFGIFYGFAWTYHSLTGRSGLGGGDVKLLAMLGAFLGPMGVFVTILLSSVLGSILGVLWAILAKEKNVMKASIPYGPFLVVGGLYYYLLGNALWLQFMIPT